MRRSIQSLTLSHDCSTFSCGNDWLDKYIQRNALKNRERGYGKTYVAVRTDDTHRIDGYFTLSMSSVQFANLPTGLAFSQMPKYPMPAAHIGCLAVARDCQRQGLGSILLIDALRRIVAAAGIVAARAVEVKAIDDAARNWYAGFGFLPFKDLGGPPFHRYLPMDVARQIVAKAQPEVQ